jgi:hypothetical protein
MDRPITSLEADVVAWLLAHPGPNEPIGPWATAPADLRVKSSCDCGCASVDFAPLSDVSDGRRPIREAVGQSPEGSQVMLILFGTNTEVCELEVIGFGDNGGRLPDVSSLRTWEQHGEELSSQ